MEYISIGKITNTHGLKGTLKVKSFTDFKEDRYKKGSLLYISFKDEFIPVTVTQHRFVKTLDYLTFRESNKIFPCKTNNFQP